MPVTLPDRVLLRVAGRSRMPIDPGDVYVLEAEGDRTRVWLGSRPSYVDVRPLGELLPRFAPAGFLRIHRNHAVNLRRVRIIRRRKRSDGWELKLDAPVNRVVPIARSAQNALWAAYGDD